MRIFLNLLVFSIIFFFSSNLLTNNIYDTNFYHINLETNNAKKTKFEQIENIKIESFNKILDKILTVENKKKLIRKINYNDIFNQIIKNIIIDNEKITQKKYIADIKVFFDKHEIIKLLRNLSINYSDFYSDNHLIASSYTGLFTNSGLSKENPFYEYDNINNIDFNNFLIQFNKPDLTPNDRYIIPYNNLIKRDLKTLNKIGKKYKNNTIFIINIEEFDKNLIVDIHFYSLKNNKINLIDKIKLDKNPNFHAFIFNYLNNWWKINNEVNNDLINELNCTFVSNNYDELQFLKSEIKNLSQFKSMSILKISYNNNIEKIQFYGDYELFEISLAKKGIKLTNYENCIINKI